MSEERSLEDLFDLIHKKQATVMLEMLESGEVQASTLGAINRFLSDNNITGVRGKDKGAQKLAEGLKKFNEQSNVAVFRR